WQVELRPVHMAPLATAPALRELELGGRVAFDAAFARALASLPQLRVLAVDDRPLDEASLRALAPCRLAGLRLARCSWAEGDALAALAALPTLERLRFEQLGKQPLGAGPLWSTSAASLGVLRDLPHLRSLEFDGCTLDDAMLAALPAQLEELS